MQKNIQLSNISIKVIRKDVKNTHLSVYPLDGSVVLVTPKKTRHEVARAYAISKINWIRSQQNRFKKQAREFPLKFIERESHLLWGRRYLMKINYKKEKPSVLLSNKEIILTVRPKTSQKIRSKVIENWHKKLFPSLQLIAVNQRIYGIFLKNIILLLGEKLYQFLIIVT